MTVSKRITTFESGSPRPRTRGGIASIVFRLTAIAFSIAVVLSATSTLAADPLVPFELQPYRVRISVAFDDSSYLDSRLKADVIQELPAFAGRLLGEMWSVTAEENTWLFPTTSEHLTELSAEAFPAGWNKELPDKSFLILIEHTGGEYRLTGREWDQTSRILGQANFRQVSQRRELGAATFRLAHDLFMPRLQVDRITDGVAALTVQGGALTPADPACAQLVKDQFWQPFLRYRNPKGEVEKIQPVPWTLLQVQDINPESRAHGQARVVSGLRSALPSRRRPRIDVFARAARQIAPETELKLISRQTPARPLIGVVIDARSKPDAPSVRLMTDRYGTVRIPVRPREPLLWLNVRSGEKLLARLPLVPGLMDQVTAELPDDSLRLRVEGELSILQSNLTDTVAQRAVLMSRIRRLAALGDWKSVRELQKEMRLLPITDHYLRDLNAIRIPALQTAEATRDRVAKAYITRVCEETSKTIQKYLDEEKLKTFEEELRELERENKRAPKAASQPAEVAKPAPKADPKPGTVTQPTVIMPPTPALPPTAPSTAPDTAQPGAGTVTTPVAPPKAPPTAKPAGPAL